MAIYGVPFAKDIDADSAVLTGIQMMKALTELNQELKAQSKPPIYIGIGINTGNVIAEILDRVKGLNILLLEIL